MSSLLTNFAGFIPYTQWKCVPGSDLCLERVDADDFSKNALCGVDGKRMLVVDQEFVWDYGKRRTYAVDWDLTCSREYLGTLLSSTYFLGALLGMVISAPLIDRYGRLFVTKVVEICGITLFILMVFSSKYYYLFVTRTLLGAAYYVQLSSIYVYLIEVVPGRFKSTALTINASFWGIGQLILALLAYLIYDWKYILVVGIVLYSVNLYLLFFALPVSPLYLLVIKKDEKGTKNSLNLLAALYGSDKVFNDDVSIVDGNVTKEQSVTESTLLETLKDFIRYPVLGRQSLAQFFIWFTAGYLYFGFSFSWGKLGKNLYLSYAIAGVGELLAYLLMGLFLKFLNRRWLGFANLIAASTFLFAMVPDNIGNDQITLSQISCLIGSTINTFIFGSLYLWTQELSPTTHRGKILSWCSSSARIGSLLGPQASLLFDWSKYGTLVIFCLIAVLSAILMFRLPETFRGKVISEASEVVSRSEQRKVKQDLEQ